MIIHSFIIQKLIQIQLNHNRIQMVHRNPLKGYNNQCRNMNSIPIHNHKKSSNNKNMENNKNILANMIYKDKKDNNLT